MAVKLDTSQGTRNVKAQAEKERNTKFMLFRVAAVVFAVLMIGNAVRKGVNGYREMKDADTKIAEITVAYDRIKAEAAVWHEQHDDKSPTDEAGAVIHTQAMYSAKLAGDEVAAIQTDFSNEKMIMPAQTQRLQELTGQKIGWFGSKVGKPDPSNPESVRFDWEFLTFYDAQVTTYDCLWACWCSSADGTGDRYLVSVRMGRYNGETNTFKMSDVDTFTSAFGGMVNEYGTIAASKESSQTTQDILDISGQLEDSGLMDDGENGDAAENTDGTGESDGEGDGEGEGGGEGDAIIRTDDDPDIGNTGVLDSGTGSM